MTNSRHIVLAFVFVVAVASLAHAQADPLPSWNDGANKRAVIEFVTRVTKESGPDFVPVAQRIATFDNDGTLWSEQPIYSQFAFALDRVKALAPHHPEWKTQQPFKAVLDGDMKTILASGELGLAEIIMATHTGITTDEFTRIVFDWLITAKHPTRKRFYTELVYQPMLELLAYLNNYTLTFPADDLPTKYAKYFWSVIAVDNAHMRVLPDPLNRFLLNKESKLEYGKDGSLTLHFAPEKPANAPEGNWLPTPKGQLYRLTFRFYGPRGGVWDGTYYPPSLQKMK